VSDGEPSAIVRWRAESRSSAVIVGSAIVAGLIGFVLTFVVARTIGAAASAGFTAVWAGTYLSVGALAGIQQEVSRASRPLRALGAPASPLFRLATMTAGVVLLVTAAVAAIWVLPAFGTAGWRLIVPLAIGPAGFIFVAFIGGSLYGIHAWGQIALLVLTDATLRLIAVLAVLHFTHDIAALAWAIAVPFGLTPLLLSPWIARRLRPGIVFDASNRVLVANASRSVAGSLATAVMVSGFTLLLVATSSSTPARTVGAVAFAVTVVRAPIVVGVMSAQNLLIVRFRDAQHPFRAAFALAVLVLAAGAVLSLGAGLLGDSILRVLVGSEYAIGGVRLATIVVSSALVGLMLVFGPLSLALGSHTSYAIGWVAAAVTTLALSLVPTGFDLRLTTSLLIPPVLGVVVQGAGLALGFRARSRAASPPRAI
jgi:O-antigen/teichoic acid export membrane protein